MPGVVFSVASRDATLKGREMCWLNSDQITTWVVMRRQGAFTQDENISKIGYRPCFAKLA